MYPPPNTPMYPPAPPPPPPEQRRGMTLPAKVLTASAIGFVLALGFCGGGSMLPGKVADITVAIGVGCLILSLILLAVGVIWFITTALARSSR